MTEEKRSTERRSKLKRRIRKIPISGDERRESNVPRRKEERRKDETE